MSKKDIIIANFLGGLAWGLGTVLGATVIVAILLYSLKAVGVFEVFKPFFENTPVDRQSLPQTDQ